MLLYLPQTANAAGGATFQLETGGKDIRADPNMSFFSSPTLACGTSEDVFVSNAAAGNYELTISKPIPARTNYFLTINSVSGTTSSATLSNTGAVPCLGVTTAGSPPTNPVFSVTVTIQNNGLTPITKKQTTKPATYSMTKATTINGTNFACAIQQGVNGNVSFTIGAADEAPNAYGWHPPGFAYYGYIENLVKGKTNKDGSTTYSAQLTDTCDPNPATISINVAKGVTPTSTTPPPPPPPSSTVNCVAGSFTWAICPLINGMLSVIQWIETNIIQPFIVEPPFDKNTPAIAPVYSIWTHMRDVASVFFILIFFLVIFGTAIGFNNYTIKKVLPHLVAGAIIMPFSWYICAIGIDIGNVLGSGLVALMGAIIPTPTIDFGSNLETIFYGAGAVVLGTIALSGMSVGLLLTILIAILATFFTLVLRKILIILLVILSPFAILAWILPNTEKIFKQWWTNLARLILMYPLILALFEAGRLFATVAGTAVGGAGTDGVRPLFQLAGLFLPLGLVPWTFSMAGGALKLGSNAIGKVGSAAEGRYGKSSQGAKERHERFQQKRAAAAMPGNGNLLSRAVARKQSGTGGFMPQGKAAQLKMRQMADKHTSFESEVAGAAKADKGLLEEAGKIEKAARAGLAAGTKTTEEFAADMEKAKGIRDTLNTGHTIGLMTQAKQEQVIAHHGELQGLAQANKKSTPDLARQLEASTTLAGDKVLAQRGEQAATRVVSFNYTDDAKDAQGRVIMGADGKAVQKTYTRTGRVSDLAPDKHTVAHLQDETAKAIQAGDQGAAIAYMQKIGESGRGRDTIKMMQSDVLGGDRSEGQLVADQYQPMFRQVMSKVDASKAPDLAQDESAAFTDVNITKFISFDKRTKQRYLDYAHQQRGTILAEAISNVNAASDARYKRQMSGDDVGALWGHAGSKAAPDSQQVFGGFMEQHRDQLDPQARDVFAQRWQDANSDKGATAPAGYILPDNQRRPTTPTPPEEEE